MRARRSSLGLLGLGLIAASLLACNFVERQFLPQPTASPVATLTPFAADTLPGATDTPVAPRATPVAPRATPAARRTPTARPTGTAQPASSPSAAAAVRACAFVPGRSTPAVMPPDVLAAYTPTPYPPPALPTNSPVDASVTAQQLKVYQQLWDAVNTTYVYPDFRGHDWKAIGAKYKALVSKGLTDNAFYLAMDMMVTELGDMHSQFMSPQAAKLADAAEQGHTDYVGVGVAADYLPEANRRVVIYTFPGSPAAQAGLRAHDSIVAANGQSLFDAQGVPRDIIRGPEGTTVTLSIERPGETPFDLTLTRRRVTGAEPIDDCLIPGTRIAYLFLPSVDDVTLPGQVRSALEAMMAGGPLDGLVLDNRENTGGALDLGETLLGFFTGGTQGNYVSHDGKTPMVITPEPIGNSQTMPMVVLVGPNTASFGEIMSGVLQTDGRARLVGQNTMGIVEILRQYNFVDGSRAWIANGTFQPLNQPNDVWEGKGVTPNMKAPSRWDLYSEATDPDLAVAVQLLQSP
jgi:carboxyl-terminal processing protease